MMQKLATYLLAIWTVSIDVTTAAQVKGVPFTNWYDGDIHEACPWTSDEVLALGASLDGDYVSPGDDDYQFMCTAKYVNFNTRFNVILLPESEDDVVKIATFANERNLKVTIRSTGHCFVGRSMEPGTLNVNMGRMRAMSVNLDDADSPTGASLTTQTGNNWGAIYEEANKHGNRVVVGGSARTVSPGGYFLGGGHSPVTPMLGLGVDSLLRIKLVTADGSILSVTATGVTNLTSDNTVLNTVDDDGDLWWSLRGGGHGFGYILEYTMMMHDPPDSITTLHMVYPSKDNKKLDVASLVLDNMAQFVSEKQDDRLGGFVLTDNLERPMTWDPNGPKMIGHLTFLFVFYGNQSAAMTLLEPIYDYRSDLNLIRNYKEYDTFWDYEQTINDETGSNLYLTNTLLQDADFSTDKAKFIDIMTSLDEEKPYYMYMACTGVLLGGKVSRAAADSSSISPNFRSSRMTLSCVTGWEGFDASRDYVVPYFKSWTHRKLYAAGAGVYPNELDYYLDEMSDWKEKIWGPAANYHRLLKTKQRWDPGALLTCHLCVGDVSTKHPVECGSAMELRSFNTFILFILALALACLN